MNILIRPRPRSARALTLTLTLTFALSSVLAQTPAATPDENPEGNTGALKAQITTGGSYDAHSGNATRIVEDLHLPNAPGVWGLNFTRYWNSVPNDNDNPYAVLPQSFGASGWSHSWEWHALEEDTSENIADDGSEEIFTTAITITFPDGHANRYKITRSNRAHGLPPNVAPPDPRLGPPYTIVEQNGFLTGGAVYDLLRDMAPDGSQFWLHLADGGSVHFTGGPGVYQASEIFDPHGLHYTLLYYGDGRLYQVLQDGGRSLNISWNGYGLIAAVQSAGAAASQTVSYNYTITAFPGSGDPPPGTDGGPTGGGPNGSTSGSMFWLTLSTVDYPEGAQAVYTYSCSYGATETSGPFFGPPALKVANDPRYTGSMTQIRYLYSGSSCPNPAPGPFNPDYFAATGSSIASEKSAETGEVVSSLGIGCYDGTRMETNGLNGWRMFYYGRSAGADPGTQGFHCLGYQLAKLTDFTNQYPLPGNLPSERQNWMQGQPRQIWDGRGIETDAIVTPGDGSGQPGEIHHVTADGTYQVFDRVNPGSSDPQDFSRVPNRFNHWLFSHRDERGLTTTYRRDSRRRVTDITYQDGSTEHFDYNGFNQVTYHRLPSGAEQFYSYDGRGLLQSESNSVDGPDARKDYTYDGLDRVATVSDGRSRNATPPAPYSTRMEYNGRHQIMAVHYAPTGQSGDPHMTYGYDAYGNCTSTTDELGHTSTYTYDSYRRCTSYTEPLDAQTSRRWDWLYDRWIVDGVGYRGTYTHTKNEWRIQIEPAFNAAGDRKMTARAHDLQNRIIIEQTGWVQPAGQIGYWHWSSDGETHYFGYDENGQKKTYIDPVNRVTTYDYDNRNRLWKTNETVNTIPRTTETLYDVTGNKTDITFPDTRSQHWRDYDSFGQPGRFIDERGNTTSLSYRWGPMKKLDLVTTYRDRDDGGTENQVTNFDYDGMGRLTWTYFPDTSNERNTYLYGQLDTFKTRKNQLKTIQYDARGRESSHSWDDNAMTPGINRSWDDASRLSSISNSVATINYGYDYAAQLASENDYVAGADGSVQTTFSRYPNGAVSQLQYPNGLLVGHDYTARGQLKTVTENSAGYWRPAVSYNYREDGKVDYQDYGNGVQSNYDYDGRGFVNWVQHYRGWQNYSARTYWRDERDRITAWQKSWDNSVNPMESGRGNHYYYDAEGELTDAYYGAADPAGNPNNWQREDHFNYDALGNRRAWDYIASRGQWMNFTRKDNGLNQYRAWWPYSWINYDDDIGNGWGSPGAANGVIMQDGWITGGFNALNQPMYIWSGGVGWTYFGYDPLGRCVKRWKENGAVSYLYYDGWNLIQDGPQSWNAEKQYIHGGRVDEVVASLRWGWDVAYHHYDASGHCTLLTGSTGNIREQYDYDAFGYPYFYDAAGNNIGYSLFANRFLFTGREWLSDLKLYDFRNRLYQPELGRFLQPDPKQFAAGDYNLYRYCHNDPVNKSDPTGMYEEDVHQTLTEFLARNAGFSGESANRIAAANQGTDTNSRTQPYAGAQARRDFHFTTTERREAMRTEAFNNRSEEQFGRYLHALQDSYSHQRGQTDRNGRPYGPRLGHLLAGHAPDKTANRPELANRMARDTYNEMRSFYQQTTGNQAPDNWNKIQGDVDQFVRTRR